MDGDFTDDLCVSFMVDDGDVIDQWHVSDSRAAAKVALIIIALRGELLAGDCLRIERRRRRSIIGAGLG